MHAYVSHVNGPFWSDVLKTAWHGRRQTTTAVPSAHVVQTLASVSV